MKFAHLADSHLGYRQYGLLQRELDFYSVFTNTIDKIIEERVDFVVHSGDLFETSKPSTNALLVVQKAIRKLNDAGIPIYAIAGNHDITMRKNAIPPQILFKQEGLKLLSPIFPFIREKDFFIGGVPFTPKNQKLALMENLKRLSQKAQDAKFKILVSHQGIDKYLPFQYELEIGDIPTNFNYYAFGHVHNYVNDEFGEGRLVYPGSSEIWKVNELKDFNKNGKGFVIVDTHGDMPEVERIKMDLPREFIEENIPFSNLNSEVLKLRNKIVNLDEKPIMNITVEGEKFDSTGVFNLLNKDLADLSLMLRPNFKITTEEEKEFVHSNTSLEINKLIAQELKEYDNEDIYNFASDLLNDLSKDKFEDAEEVIQNFYNTYLAN